MDKDGKFNFYYAISLGVQLGFTVIMPIAISICLGVWLDNKYNTKPVFILTGIIVGLIFTFYGIYNLLKPFLRNK